MENLIKQISNMPLDFFIFMVLPVFLFLISAIILLNIAKHKNDYNLLGISKSLFFCSIPVISTVAMMGLITFCVVYPFIYLFHVMPNNYFENQKIKMRDKCKQ